MRRSLAGFLFLSSLAFPALAEPLRITGRILSSPADTRIELHRQGRGYEAAVRQLEGKTEPPIASIRPRADGGFEILAPEAGFFRLVARAEGYLDQEYPLAPIVDDTEVPPVELRRPASVKVRAVGPDGRPAAGIRLLAFSIPGWLASANEGSAWWPSERQGTTGEDGEVALSRGGDEEIFLTVADPGFLGQTMAGQSDSTEIRLNPQRLSVVVRGEDGKPVPGTLAWSGLRLPVAVANAEGRMSLARQAAEQGLILEAPDGRRQMVLPTVSPLSEVRLPPLQPVAGKVLDAATGAPLANALVWSGWDKPARTGADGGFQIPMPGQLGETIQAAASGYVPIALMSEGIARARPLSLLLERSTVLAGTVVEGEGRPVAGVSVSAHPFRQSSYPMAGGNDWNEVSSRADGSFRIPRLAAGQTYLLSAKRAGFAMTRQRAETAPTGKTLPPVRVVLSRGATLAGRVVDEQGRPVAGAEVRLIEGGEGGAGFFQPVHVSEWDQGLSDAEGRFRLPGRNAGRFELSIRGKGFAPAVVPGIEIAEGASEVDAGEVRLQAGAAIEGIVVDERGGPLPDVFVHILPARGSRLGFRRFPQERRGWIKTGPDGRFRIAELTPGERFEITAKAEGFPIASLSGVQAPSAQPVRIELKAGRTVTGRVLGPDGRPVAGADVWISRESEDFEDIESLTSSSETGTRSDEEGRFRVPEQESGKVTVAIEAAGYRRELVRGVRIPEDADPPPVEITLERGAVLEGRVLDGDQPVRGARVQGHIELNDIDDFLLLQPILELTDEEGHYRLEGLNHGSYEIQVQHPERPQTVRGRAEIRPGVNRLDLRFPEGVEVSGRAFDEFGNPVAAMVFLRPVDSGDTFTATAMSDGTFRFPAVTEGEFWLSAAAAGFAESTHPAEVRVSGSPVSGLELRLARGAVIRGRLLGVSPEQAAGADIEAHVMERGRVVRMLGGAGYADGGYRIPEASPGTWMVRVRLDDGRSASGEVRVNAAGEEAILDLQFPSGFTGTPPG